jgi:hypothetical protein
MKNSKVAVGDPRRANRAGRYHPMGEYIRQRNALVKKISTNSATRFHRLAAKLERLLPRGMREKGDMFYSTTCCVVECMVEEQSTN